MASHPIAWLSRPRTHRPHGQQRASFTITTCEQEQPGTTTHSTATSPHASLGRRPASCPAASSFCSPGEHGLGNDPSAGPRSPNESGVGNTSLLGDLLLAPFRFHHAYAAAHPTTHVGPPGESCTPDSFGDTAGHNSPRLFSLNERIRNVAPTPNAAIPCPFH